MAGPIVVVGGGTAGCTVAAHLASRTTREIMLVEPGSPSRLDDRRRFHDVLADRSLTRSTEATIVRGRDTEPYLEARALGGGSAINGMVLSGDAPPELADLTRVARPDEIGVVGGALVAAGGRPTRLWWNGGRWNPGRAVEHLAEEGRIEIVADEVVALELDANGPIVDLGTRSITTSHVVVCAGAIATPRILLASGFGKFNRAIGVGLQTHPVVSFALDIEPVDDPRTFDAAVVLESRSENGRSILSIAYERADTTTKGIGVVATMLMDVESRGRVGRENDSNHVDFNSLSSSGDMSAMTEAVRGLVTLCQTKPFLDIVSGVSIDDVGTPISEIADLGGDGLESWVRGHVGVVSHATSSCCDAVDRDGRLYGVDGVWVADASVIDAVPNCTPAGHVTMVARRIARNVVATLT